MKKITFFAAAGALAVLCMAACGRTDNRRWGNAVIESIDCERATSFVQYMDTISTADKDYEIAKLTIRFRWADKSKGLVLLGPEICLRDEQGGHYLMNSSQIEFSLPKDAKVQSMAEGDAMTLFFAVRKKIKLASLEWRNLSLNIPF